METNDSSKTAQAPEYPDEVMDYERGCGSLKNDSAYLTADVSAFGTLPTFVEFETPIPYREGHFRTFKRINGTEMLLDAAQGDHALTAESPADEVLAHIERARDSLPTDSQAGGLDSMRSQDLLMFVGKSYYETPEEFIAEARTQGVSKKIPASKNQEPPRVNAGRTRLFLIHPRAIPTGKDEDGNVLDIDAEDDDKADPDEQVFIPGIVGYSYLTRTIVTPDVTGEYSDEFEEMSAKRDDIDLVRISDFVPADEPDHPQYDESDEEASSDDADDEADEDTADEQESRDEPVSESDSVEAEADDNPLAGRNWSPKAQEMLAQHGVEDPTPEFFARLLDVDHQPMRTVMSKLGLGHLTGAQPTLDEMYEVAGRVPVYRGAVGDGDLYVDVDGASYTVEEIAEMREDGGTKAIPAASVKAAAQEGDN